MKKIISSILAIAMSIALIPQMLVSASEAVVADYDDCIRAQGDYLNNSDNGPYMQLYPAGKYADYKITVAETGNYSITMEYGANAAHTNTQCSITCLDSGKSSGVALEQTTDANGNPSAYNTVKNSTLKTVTAENILLYEGDNIVRVENLHTATSDRIFVSSLTAILTATSTETRPIKETINIDPVADLVPGGDGVGFIDLPGNESATGKTGTKEGVKYFMLRPGEWVRWKVDVEKAGVYSITYKWDIPGKQWTRTTIENNNQMMYELMPDNVSGSKTGYSWLDAPHSTNVVLEKGANIIKLIVPNNWARIAGITLTLIEEYPQVESDVMISKSAAEGVKTGEGASQMYGDALGLRANDYYTWDFDVPDDGYYRVMLDWKGAASYWGYQWIQIDFNEIPKWSTSDAYYEEYLFPKKNDTRQTTAYFEKEFELKKGINKLHIKTKSNGLNIYNVILVKVCDKKIAAKDYDTTNISYTNNTGSANGESFVHLTSNYPKYEYDLTGITPGQYDVTLYGGAARDDAGFKVSCGDESVTNFAKKTGSYMTYAASDMGTINVTEGNKLSVEFESGSGMYLVRVLLTKHVPHTGDVMLDVDDISSSFATISGDTVTLGEKESNSSTAFGKQWAAFNVKRDVPGTYVLSVDGTANSDALLRITTNDMSKESYKYVKAGESINTLVTLYEGDNFLNIFAEEGEISFTGVNLTEMDMSNIATIANNAGYYKDIETALTEAELTSDESALYYPEIIYMDMFGKTYEDATAVVSAYNEGLYEETKNPSITWADGIITVKEGAFAAGTRFIAAVYDNNKLMSVASAEAKADSDVTVALAETDKANAKILVWTSFEAMKPYASK